MLAGAVRAFEAGRLQEAEAHCRQILAENPKDAEAWHMFGVAVARQGAFEVAAAALREALALKPETPRILVDLGAVLAEMSQPTAALSSFERALAVDPRNVVALVSRGRVLEHLGRPDDAVQSYRDALTVDPAHGPALDPLCRQLRRRGLQREVESICTAALAIDPALATAHTELGLVALERGDPQAALQCFERTVTAAPDLEFARRGRSAALAQAGRMDAARAAAAEVWRREPVRSRPSVQAPEATVLVLRCTRNFHYRWHDGHVALFGPVNSTNLVRMLDRQRVAVHDVVVNALPPTAKLADLPPCDVIFNAISDPDVGGPSLGRAARLLEGASVPVVNRPETVIASTRDRNADGSLCSPGSAFRRPCVSGSATILSGRWKR